MALIEEDMQVLILQAPAVVPATSIFRSTMDNLPPAPAAGPFVVIIAGGGTGPLYIQNVKSPNLRRPAVQFSVHATLGRVAETTAQALYARVTSVTNQDINGVRYVRIVPFQEPFDGGPDPSTGRARFQFNVFITKRP